MSNNIGLWETVERPDYLMYEVFLTAIDEAFICGIVAETVTWWRHQMETFSALLAICAGNSPITGEFPPQRQVTRSFDVFFDLSEQMVE